MSELSSQEKVEDLRNYSDEVIQDKLNFRREEIKKHWNSALPNMPSNTQETNNRDFQSHLEWYGELCFQKGLRRARGSNSISWPSFILGVLAGWSVSSAQLNSFFQDLLRAIGGFSAP